MVDRYTRVVLTVIAVCLVYLCLVVSKVGTPLSAQQQQQAGTPPPGAARPGLGTGPAEVVVVGWRVSEEDGPLPVEVRNTVTTQPSSDNPTRVVVAGWEDPRRGVTVRLSTEGLPVDLGASRAGKVVLAGTEPSPGAWRQRIPVDTSRDAAPTKR